MAENPWITKLKLALLAAIGLAIVSVPVTLALAMSADGDSSVALRARPQPVTHHRDPHHGLWPTLRCAPARGYYALTFDDGPYPQTTRRLVGALRRAGAVATFFDVGQRAASQGELVDEQRGVGQVANHSYTHSHLPQLSTQRRLQELTETARVLDYPNAFVRPPYGETSASTDLAMRQTGLLPVYWTTDTYDWQAPPVAVIVARALQVQPGGVILLHDGRDTTVDAVGPLVAALRTSGMCPGLLARTAGTVVSAYKHVKFHVVAVAPTTRVRITPQHGGRR